MVSLAGLSAVYPGFQQAQGVDLQNRMREAQAGMAETEMAGQQAFGNTLKFFQQQIPGAQPAQGMGGMQPAAGGQQPPMPGQASVPAGPMAPQPQMGGGMLPAAARPPGMQPQGAPGAPGGAVPPQGGLPQGAMDWRQLSAAVVRANPGAKPEVIAAAVNRFLPLMNAQSQQEWKQIQQQLAGERIDVAREGLDVRRSDIERKETQFTEREKRLTEQFEERKKQFETRESRLRAKEMVGQDLAVQRLEIQKQNLRRQVEQGDRRQGLAQLKAVIDAQHKRAMEVIQSQAALLPAAERKTLLTEQKAFYDKEINELRDTFGSSTPSGGAAAPGGKTQGRMQTDAPIVAPQPGEVRNGYRFKGGNPADQNSWEKVSGT